MITIDGINYNVEWIAKSFKQTADILNGDNSGRLQGTKSMFLEYIGTFYNSTGKIHRSKNCTAEEWNNLFLVLSNPINNHTVKIPFGKGFLTTEIYISKLERTLIKQESEFKWDSVYEVTFTSTNSQWLAGGSLQGYSEV